LWKNIDAYNNLVNDSNPILYIIDEAHRYRNESTDNYKMLHQITRSNPNNEFILLTTTPYNNITSDLLVLIKLFQIPKFSTISVKNLDAKFDKLKNNYNKLKKKKRKKIVWMNQLKKELIC